MFRGIEADSLASVGEDNLASLMFRWKTNDEGNAFDG